jgi:SAM-dependent methyltransferase
LKEQAGQEPTKRFTGREGDYSKGRPDYPRELIRVLETHSSFSNRSVVADIGSGTGKLTTLFLDNGNESFAIEPNPDMRREAERLLGRRANFHSLPGTAEDTGLPERSVDLVTAGQSFHWFDKPRAKREFQRILRYPGNVVLVWNSRRLEKGSFGFDYEKLAERNRRESNRWTSGDVESESISEFFKKKFLKVNLQNKQELDLSQLIARIRSASYMPNSGNDAKKLERETREVFEKHAVRGRVTMDYDTEIFLGNIL